MRALQSSPANYSTEWVIGYRSTSETKVLVHCRLVFQHVLNPSCQIHDAAHCDTQRLNHHTSNGTNSWLCLGKQWCCWVHMAFEPLVCGWAGFYSLALLPQALVIYLQLKLFLNQLSVCRWWGEWAGFTWSTIGLLWSSKLELPPCGCVPPSTGQVTHPSLFRLINYM